MPNVTVRTARRAYRCSWRYENAACQQEIRKGDPYTQMSYAPFEKPENARGHDWLTLHVCMACEPLGGVVEKLPCPAVVDGDRCLRDAHPDTIAHEFPIGLF
jgi:hypothetical protein